MNSGVMKNCMTGTITKIPRAQIVDSFTFTIQPYRSKPSITANAMAIIH